MPVIKITTNLLASALPKNFHLSTATMLAEVMSKPLQGIAVLVNAGASFSFGGTEEPAAYIQVKAIGVINEMSNNGFAERLTAHFATVLSIPPPRILIQFVPLLPENVAKNGVTVKAAQAKT